MEGLEDAWPRYRYFLLTIGHVKSFTFERRLHFTSKYIVASTEQF